MARDIREARAKRKVYEITKLLKAIRFMIPDDYLIELHGHEFEVIRNGVDDILKEIDPNALV